MRKCARDIPQPDFDGAYFTGHMDSGNGKKTITIEFPPSGTYLDDNQFSYEGEFTVDALRSKLKIVVDLSMQQIYFYDIEDNFRNSYLNGGNYYWYFGPLPGDSTLSIESFNPENPWILYKE